MAHQHKASTVISELLTRLTWFTVPGSDTFIIHIIENQLLNSNYFRFKSLFGQTIRI
jgi:hypothetical protein